MSMLSITSAARSFGSSILFLIFARACTLTLQKILVILFEWENVRNWRVFESIKKKRLERYLLLPKLRQYVVLVFYVDRSGIFPLCALCNEKMHCDQHEPGFFLLLLPNIICRIDKCNNEQLTIRLPSFNNHLNLKRIGQKHPLGCQECLVVRWDWIDLFSNPRHFWIWGKTLYNEFEMF